MIGRIDSSETMLRRFVCCGQGDTAVLCELFHFDIQHYFVLKLQRYHSNLNFVQNFALDFKSMNIGLFNTGLATSSVVEICPVSRLLKRIIF